ncbi:MAG: NDP-sugar synthase [Candidatus Melainabacteria bacterium]
MSIRVADHAPEHLTLTLVPQDEPDCFSIGIADDRNGAVETIGTLSARKECRKQVELFLGKGGFTAVISPSSGLRYYVLPGSRFAMDGIELTLNGPVIASDPALQKTPQPEPNPQTHVEQALILGAGLSTRFEPLSGEWSGYSKPAVPLAGPHSVIHHIASHLAQHGNQRVLVNTLFKPASLKEGLRDFEVYYLDEAIKSGTLGPLRQILKNPGAYHFDPGAPMFSLYGDAVTDVDLSHLARVHQEKNALITFAVLPREDVEKWGISVTDRSGHDGSGYVTGFQEKPSREEAQSNLANTGICVYAPEVYPYIEAAFQAVAADQREQPGFEFNNTNHLFYYLVANARRIERETGKKAMWAEEVTAYWRDIGSGEQYVETTRDIFAGKTHVTVPSNPSDYYDNGIIYWPGAKALAQADAAQLHGNIVVALPYAARN